MNDHVYAQIENLFSLQMKYSPVLLPNTLSQVTFVSKDEIYSLL